LKVGTPKAVKSQAIADLLAQFPGEEEFPLKNEVPGEVATAEMAVEQWVMKFYVSSMANSGGTEVFLYHNGEETVALSFKLEFPCSKNTAKYEAFLTRLATTLKMGIKNLRVISDSNLVVGQAKGSFSLKEPSMDPYRTLAQRMEKKFCTFAIEHAQRSENQYADSLAMLSSQIAFERGSSRVDINKRRESIIEIL